MNATAPVVMDHETTPAPKEGRAVSAQVIKTDAAKILEVITKAAKDPSVDVDKLDRLMGMYERIKASTAKEAFAAALAELQPLLPVITERGRIEVTDKADRSKVIQSTGYARWEDINQAIRAPLAEHGFALSFRTGLADDGKITVTGILSHRDGHAEETTITLPHDSTGSKNAVQAVGSSTSYGKRYTACALLNITSRGEDDDAFSSCPNDWITEHQVADLVALMEEVNADRTRFLNFLKIDTLAHLPRTRLQEAIRALEAKRGAQ
jgi:hypothetical protein